MGKGFAHTNPTFNGLCPLQSNVTPWGTSWAKPITPLTPPNALKGRALIKAGGGGIIKEESLIKLLLLSFSFLWALSCLGTPPSSSFRGGVHNGLCAYKDKKKK